MKHFLSHVAGWLDDRLGHAVYMICCLSLRWCDCHDDADGLDDMTNRKDR